MEKKGQGRESLERERSSHSFALCVCFFFSNAASLTVPARGRKISTLQNSIEKPTPWQNDSLCLVNHIGIVGASELSSALSHTHSHSLDGLAGAEIFAEDLISHAGDRSIWQFEFWIGWVRAFEVARARGAARDRRHRTDGGLFIHTLLPYLIRWAGRGLERKI